MSKYEVVPSNRFLKELKQMKKRGADTNKIKLVIDELSAGNTLPVRYRDHVLNGDYKGLHECHIELDWFLIYEIDGKKLRLLLLRTGTHSDLF